MTEKRVPCEVWTRIVGYYRPKRKGAEGWWNPGALRMSDDRRMFRPFDDDMNGWQNEREPEKETAWLDT